MGTRKAFVLASMCLLMLFGCKDKDEDASDEPSFKGADIGELRVNSTVKLSNGEWTVKLYIHRSDNKEALKAEDLDVVLITSEAIEIAAETKEPKSDALAEWNYKYWRSEMMFKFKVPDKKPKIVAMEVSYKKQKVKPERK